MDPCVKYLGVKSGTKLMDYAVVKDAFLKIFSLKIFSLEYVFLKIFSFEWIFFEIFFLKMFSWMMFSWKMFSWVRNHLHCHFLRSFVWVFSWKWILKWILDSFFFHGARFRGCLSPNFLAVFDPSHLSKLLMITPPRNPPPPGFRIIYVSFPHL